MTFRRRTRAFCILATVAMSLLALAAVAAEAADPGGQSPTAGKPLKVYILAGQSNMEGQAKVETFDYIGDDPATAPLLKEMRGPDGKPRVCENVWISYLTGSPDRSTLGEGFGKLTAGYGARSNPKEDGGKIGPEFTFGITMDKAYDGPILIIKTAWGGKSLNTDFRPPIAGPYEFNEAQLENLEEAGQGLEQAKADKAAKTGPLLPADDRPRQEGAGRPQAGRSGLRRQAGLRDRRFRLVPGLERHGRRRHVPQPRQAGRRYAKYSEWMADFIRDVRKDLDAPKMPFVIGVMGVGGPIGEDYNPRYKVTHENFRTAMAAPAKLPEFKGNVAAVRTGLYWDKPLAAIADKFGKVSNMSPHLRSKAKGTAQRRRQDDAQAAAGVSQGVPRESDHARGRSHVATRRLQRRLPLPRLRQDHGPDRQAFAEAILEMETCKEQVDQ